MNSRGTVLRSIVAFFAALIVWPLLAHFIAARLIVERPLNRADVIVVLAGAATYSERTQTAALLYKKSISNKILLTNDGERAGWSEKEQRNPPLFDLAKGELIAQGVPEGAIEVLAPRLSGTIMEAELLAQETSRRRWKSLLIVTSPFHTRRALRAFEKVFAETSIDIRLGIVPAVIERDASSASWWWLTWEGWRDVAGEYAKSAYYYFAY